PLDAGGRRRPRWRRQHALYRHVGDGSARPRHLGAEPGDRVRRDPGCIRERRNSCGYPPSPPAAKPSCGLTAHARKPVTSLLPPALLHLPSPPAGAVELVPARTRSFLPFPLDPVALAIGVAAAAIMILGLSLVGALADGRVQEHDQRLITAVNNMSHGVVMFS